ncbi:hypothetical protein BGX26_004204, partial [Mortierella sp. AD094]
MVQETSVQGRMRLANPKTQIQAVKAKWLARWQTSKPRWKGMITKLARKHYDLDSQLEAVKFLKAPKQDIVAKANEDYEGPQILNSMVEAYLSLDPVIVPRRTIDHVTIPRASIPMAATPAIPTLSAATLACGLPGSDILFRDRIQMSMFTVKRARDLLDKKEFEKQVAKKQSKQIYKQAPTYKNLRLRQRVSEDHTDPARIDLSEKEWDTVFKRMHSKQRRANEKNFLYELAHHCINTNAIKRHYNYEVKKTKGECRRCTPLALTLELEAEILDEMDEEEEEEERRNSPPPATPDTDVPEATEPVFAMESRPHAFHECSKVAEAWIRVRAWAKELYPDIVLPENYAQSVTCWPSVKKLPPIMIHLHSVITNSIWRTYCQLGDGEQLKMDGLRWMTVQALFKRAKIELERAKYRDMLEGDKLTKNIRKGLVREDFDNGGNDNNGETEEEEEPIVEHVLWTID